MKIFILIPTYYLCLSICFLCSHGHKWEENIDFILQFIMKQIVVYNVNKEFCTTARWCMIFLFYIWKFNFFWRKAFTYWELQWVWIYTLFIQLSKINFGYLTPPGLISQVRKISWISQERFHIKTVDKDWHFFIL